MSRTIRRKKNNFVNLFLLSERDLNEHGRVEGHWDKALAGLTLEEANKKKMQCSIPAAAQASTTAPEKLTVRNTGRKANSNSGSN